MKLTSVRGFNRSYDMLRSVLFNTSKHCFFIFIVFQVTTELNSEISASNTTAANLSALAAVLETGLNKTSTNLTAIKQKCLDDVEAFCGDLPNGTLIPTSFTLDVSDLGVSIKGLNCESHQHQC